MISGFVTRKHPPERIGGAGKAMQRASFAAPPDGRPIRGKAAMRHQASGYGRRLAILLLAGWFGIATTIIAPAAPALAQPAPSSLAPPAATRNDDVPLTQPQLEALLAPIALFPDELLMQVLMAATYPLEIVQAARWLAQAQNAQLRGEALATALQPQPWDPSVKSLVPFPDLLKMLNEQLEWTQQLGDAVLAQQEDVLNTVQVLRGRAQDAGHLKSTEQQVVSVSPAEARAPSSNVVVVQAPPQIITIAPAQPDVIFVPVYNPSVVFGRWPHPTFPPVFFPPPPAWGLGNALLTGMAFAAGAAVVGSLWGWARPAWGRGNVNVNVNRFNSINVNRTQITSNNWRHDVTHRGGLSYRNTEVNNRFRGDVASGRTASRDEFRGRMQQVDRGGGLDAALRPGAGNRPGPGDRGPAGENRPGLGDRGPAGENRPSPGDRRPGGENRPNLGDRGPVGENRPNPGDRRPGGENRPNPGDRRPDAANRPNLADRRPDGATRPNLGQAPSGRPAVPNRPAANRPPPQALQGIGQGGDVRAAAQRGAASRQAQPAARPQVQQRAAAAGAARPQAAPRQAPARPSGGGGGGGRLQGRRG